MALLGHVSAEMSLRYAHLFDSTVRAEYERALDLAKGRIGAMPTPTGKTRIPVSGASLRQLQTTMTGETPRRSSRASPAATASERPPKAPAPTPTSANTAPASAPTPPRSPVLAAQRVDTEALLDDAAQRGWIDEADRHRRLLDRLDTLIAQADAG